MLESELGGLNDKENLGKAGYYYNITDRDVEEVKRGFGLDLNAEMVKWPKDATVLISGLGSKWTLESQILDKLPSSRLIGIDGSLGLDDSTLVFQDQDGVYHLYPEDEPPLLEIPNSSQLTYREYQERRRAAMPDLRLIVDRVPPINLPDTSVDVILDINGPAAYMYQHAPKSEEVLLGEYERISSKKGPVYISTSMLLYTPQYYARTMPSYGKVAYSKGEYGEIVKLAP